MPTPTDDTPPEDLVLGPGMVIMAWREGDTTSTIDDALRDGPRIVAETAAEVAERRGVPVDWMTQLWRLAAAHEEDAS